MGRFLHGARVLARAKREGSGARMAILLVSVEVGFLGRRCVFEAVLLDNPLCRPWAATDALILGGHDVACSFCPTIAFDTR